MEYLKDFLAIVGVVASLGMIWFILDIAYQVLKEIIDKLKWKYKYKHRFDKPPIAKCYCKDCIYYCEDGFNNKCKRGHINEQWNIADTWFCWQAEPHKEDHENKTNI